MNYFYLARIRSLIDSFLFLFYESDAQHNLYDARRERTRPFFFDFFLFVEMRSLLCLILSSSLRTTQSVRFRFDVRRFVFVLVLCPYRDTPYARMGLASTCCFTIDDWHLNRALAVSLNFVFSWAHEYCVTEFSVWRIIFYCWAGIK